ncbi:hypothetical protein [Streptomyces sp. NPDC047928]|uniref:hypothetical protein n=1 Tax=unclassified Streptomyces TaxID=2593676 RepID=UPI00371C93BA
MTVDPTDPENLTELDEETGAEAVAIGIDEETPEADAAEQHTELQQRADDPLTGTNREAANDADIAEQARVVTLDEDDYRS